jgi:hypothetical protein
LNLLKGVAEVFPKLEVLYDGAKVGVRNHRQIVLVGGCFVNTGLTAITRSTTQRLLSLDLESGTGCKWLEPVRVIHSTKLGASAKVVGGTSLVFAARRLGPGEHIGYAALASVPLDDGTTDCEATVGRARLSHNIPGLQVVRKGQCFRGGTRAVALAAMLLYFWGIWALTAFGRCLLRAIPTSPQDPLVWTSVLLGILTAFGILKIREYLWLDKLLSSSPGACIQLRDASSS